MSTILNPKDFFITGGALAPDAPSYVKRPADDELFNLVLEENYCYVLTPRQMGKSSLKSQIARRLEKQDIYTASIDLTAMGTPTSVEQWYLGLLYELKRKLKLSVDLEAWWLNQASLGPVQRFTNFLRDVILTEIKKQVVIFIDEIDYTIKLEFSDDFFAAIRAMYNARSDNSELNRLAFVLLGVASPSDLIKDNTRTPFNIGQGITLHDFNRADAAILQAGLQAIHHNHSEAIFNRIFYWTNGHPYLTQKLCQDVVKTNDGSWTEQRIDALVEKLFLTKKASRESNLKFVRDTALAYPAQRQLLRTYHQVYQGKRVNENEQSPLQNHLKLSGLVDVEDGYLQVRNQIYRQVFDLAWIRENLPFSMEYKKQIVALTVIFLMLFMSFITWQINQQVQPDDVLAASYEQAFADTTNPTLRLDNLARLFGLEGYDDQSSTLFNTLSLAEKVALFDNITPDLQPQVIAVVRGTYTNLEDIEADNQILGAMQTGLELSGELILSKEITHWLEGRSAAALGIYEDANIAYIVAIELNSKNPTTHFERAVLLTALGDYDGALTDFNTALSLNKSRQTQIQQLIEDNPQLYQIWWNDPKKYPFLSFIPTPTPMSILVATSTPKNTPVSPTLTTEPTQEPTIEPTQEVPKTVLAIQDLIKKERDIFVESNRNLDKSILQQVYIDDELTVRSESIDWYLEHKAYRDITIHNIEIFNIQITNTIYAIADMEIAIVDKTCASPTQACFADKSVVYGNKYSLEKIDNQWYIAKIELLDDRWDNTPYQGKAMFYFVNWYTRSANVDLEPIEGTQNEIITRVVDPGDDFHVIINPGKYQWKTQIPGTDKGTNGDIFFVNPGNVHFERITVK